MLITSSAASDASNHDKSCFEMELNSDQQQKYQQQFSEDQPTVIVVTDEAPGKLTEDFSLSFVFCT